MYVHWLFRNTFIIIVVVVVLIGPTIPVCLSKGTAPDLNATPKRWVNNTTSTLSSAVHLWLKLTHPYSLLLWRFLTISAWRTPEISGTASRREGMLSALSSSSKCLFLHSTISPKEVNTPPHLLNRACAWSQLPILRHQRIWPDIFGATPKSFSIASSDSFHAEAFVYANAFATALQLSYTSQLTQESPLWALLRRLPSSSWQLLSPLVSTNLS